MTKKHKLLSLALILVLTLSLAACGAASATPASETEQYAAAPDLTAAETPEEAGEISYMSTASAAELSGSPSTAFTPEKIIYAGYAEIETLDFDKSMAALTALIESCGGFIQSSSVTGGDYNTVYRGKPAYRRADYTIRVPVESYDSVRGSLSALGHVVSSSTNAENITMQYTDTEARLETYRTQESRLLDLLAKADSVADMIIIENAISEVRYQLESLTSQIKNWDSQISYSTLSLYISEVSLYSEDNSSSIGYGQQLAQTFRYSLYSVGGFFKSFFKFLVGAFPVIVVLAVIAVPVVLAVRTARKKAEKRKGSGGPEQTP
ncbi:MAG: DUF4349 domain-containing protein [Oscillospiraceae bacterium]|jgi:hypothetical protein|nr:DUF4349 domain-containing protein [Oscillospiraceae bacterium]